MLSAAFSARTSSDKSAYLLMSASNADRGFWAFSYRLQHKSYYVNRHGHHVTASVNTIALATDTDRMSMTTLQGVHNNMSPAKHVSIPLQNISHASFLTADTRYT